MATLYHTVVEWNSNDATYYEMHPSHETSQTVPFCSNLRMFVIPNTFVRETATGASAHHL